MLGNTKRNVECSYSNANDETKISFNWVYKYVIHRLKILFNIDLLNLIIQHEYDFMSVG